MADLNLLFHLFKSVQHKGKNNKCNYQGWHCLQITYDFLLYKKWMLFHLLGFKIMSHELVKRLFELLGKETIGIILNLCWAWNWFEQKMTGDLHKIIQHRPWVLSNHGFLYHIDKSLSYTSWCEKHALVKCA